MGEVDRSPIRHNLFPVAPCFLIVKLRQRLKSTWSATLSWFAVCAQDQPIPRPGTDTRLIAHQTRLMDEHPGDAVYGTTTDPPAGRNTGAAAAIGPGSENEQRRRAGIVDHA